MRKRVFVTVGSTTFPELVTAVLNPNTTRVLESLDYNEILLQYGADSQLYAQRLRDLSTELSINGFEYSPSIQGEMEQADLIISHAGRKVMN